MADIVIGGGPPVDGEAQTITLSDAVQTLLACDDLAALKTALGIDTLETAVSDLDARVTALEPPA